MHHDLADAARRTLAALGSTELVDLVEHQIIARQQPSVAILVDGRRVAVVELDLSIEFDVSSAVAEIKAGLLVAMRSGRCDATAALAIQGTDAATRKRRAARTTDGFRTPGTAMSAALDSTGGRFREARRTAMPQH